MSLWSTLWTIGRLVRSAQIDFWQISLTRQDPSIPNLPLNNSGNVSLLTSAKTLTLTKYNATISTPIEVLVDSSTLSLTTYNYFIKIKIK